jgi:hypothetical protein
MSEFIMKYGQHKNKTASEIPTQYLCYIYQEAKRTLDAVGEELEKRHVDPSEHYTNFRDHNQNY